MRTQAPVAFYRNYSIPAHRSENSHVSEWVWCGWAFRFGRAIRDCVCVGFVSLQVDTKQAFQQCAICWAAVSPLLGTFQFLPKGRIRFVLLGDPCAFHNVRNCARRNLIFINLIVKPGAAGWTRYYWNSRWMNIYWPCMELNALAHNRAHSIYLSIDKRFHFIYLLSSQIAGI